MNMTELEILRQNKLDVISLNFSQLLEDKDPSFILEIIRYIDQVKQCNDLEQLKLTEIDLGKPSEMVKVTNPLLKRTEVVTFDSYISEKIRNVYRTQASGSVVIADVVDDLILTYINAINYNLPYTDGILTSLIKEEIRKQSL